MSDGFAEDTGSRISRTRRRKSYDPSATQEYTDPNSRTPSLLGGSLGFQGNSYHRLQKDDETDTRTLAGQGYIPQGQWFTSGHISNYAQAGSRALASKVVPDEPRVECDEIMMHRLPYHRQARSNSLPQTSRGPDAPSDPVTALIVWNPASATAVVTDPNTTEPRVPNVLHITNDWGGGILDYKKTTDALVIAQTELKLNKDFRHIDIEPSALHYPSAQTLRIKLIKNEPGIESIPLIVGSLGRNSLPNVKEIEIVVTIPDPKMAVEWEKRQDALQEEVFKSLRGFLPRLERLTYDIVAKNPEP